MRQDTELFIVFIVLLLLLLMFFVLLSLLQVEQFSLLLKTEKLREIERRRSTREKQASDCCLFTSFGASVEPPHPLTPIPSFINRKQHPTALSVECGCTDTMKRPSLIPVRCESETAFLGSETAFLGSVTCADP